MDPRWLAELGDAGVDAAIARTIHAESLGAFLREVACGNAFHTFDPAPRREAGRAIAPIAREPLDLFGRHRPAGMPRRPQAPQRTHVNRLPSSRTAMRLAGKAA
jgi:hypothetical protein